MPQARKLWPILTLATACSQTVAPPSLPRSAPVPDYSARQKVLITKQDLAPIDPKRFLYVFPIEPSGEVTQAIQRDQQPLLSADTADWCLRLNLRHLERSERRDLLRRLGAKDQHKDYVQVPWQAAPAHDQPTPNVLASSFVIDYDDPRFEKFWAKIQRSRGDASRVESLVDIVARHIELKTTTRMFDTAAEVAESHQGDCTEHATLLTALLRRSGRPARLVTGLAVLVDGHELGAFGHAWTELYENGSWHVADAALHPIPGHSSQRVRAIRYLAVARMVDESAGFAAAMGNVSNVEAISSVRVQSCKENNK